MKNDAFDLRKIWTSWQQKEFEKIPYFFVLILSPVLFTQRSDY